MLSDRDVRLANEQEECLRKIWSSENADRKSPKPLLASAKTEELLELLQVVYQICDPESIMRTPSLVPSTRNNEVIFSTFDEAETDDEEDLEAMTNQLSINDFVSKSLSYKLVRQLMDPLAVAGSALPDWCITLPRRLSSLFPYEIRLNLLRSSAFGQARFVLFSSCHFVCMICFFWFILHVPVFFRRSFSCLRKQKKLKTPRLKIT